MKIQPQTRLFQIAFDRAHSQDRTIEMTFSSEAPVDRWFGTEVLDHSPDSVRLGRLNDGAPLLFNHNIDDVIGVVESAWIGGDRRGYATVRLAKTPRADEVLGMIRDEILRNVSFMYRIHKAEEEPKTGLYRVVDWEAMEISVVTVPADNSIGIGRSWASEDNEVLVTRANEQVHQPAAPAANKEKAIMADPNAAAGASAEIDMGKDNGMQERLRIVTISRLAATHKIADEQRDNWINGGTDAETVAREILDVIAERAKKGVKPTELDLSTGDTRRFSIMRGILAAHDKNWQKAGFEAECSRTIAQRLGVTPDPHKFYVPLDVQSRKMPTPEEFARYGIGKRDLTVASASGGGYLVATENQSFIDVLRNRSVMYNMGARRMSGLVGSVTIPKQTASATAYWLSTEATAITESQQTFGQLVLTPKTVGAYTEISRLLALQSSPDAEAIVNADLAAQVALAVDAAGINGSGAAGQPQGIIGTAGVGSVTGTSIAYAGIIEFQTDVAASNALFGSSGYVTTPAVAGLLKQRVKFTNTASPLWDGSLLDASVDGYRGMASNQMPSANILFGAFDQVVIGEWGVLEIEVNPYANFAAGIMGVRAIYTVDVGVRYGAAFSLATSVT